MPAWAAKGWRVKEAQRGEERKPGRTSPTLYLPVATLCQSCAPAKGTFPTPLCGSSPPGIPASSRKSPQMPSCPAREHRILLWVPTSPSAVNSLGCGV